MGRRWRGGRHSILSRWWSRRRQSEGVARIAISGGSTPKAAFQLLADPGQPWLKRMPWDKLEIYWVDERTVPPDHPDSNYRMTREAMLDHVPLKPEQVHRMEGELEPEVAAARYESLLRNNFRLEGAETPRFDLIALGMGDDGHTASIFPHTEAIHTLGRLVTANQVPQKDTWRITLTWPVINQGSSVFFLIGGQKQGRTGEGSLHGAARSGAAAEPTDMARKRYTHSDPG